MRKSDFNEIELSRFGGRASGRYGIGVFALLILARTAAAVAIALTAIHFGGAFYGYLSGHQSHAVSVGIVEK